MSTGRKLLLDPTASSADAVEATFIARPEGAPVYYGFAKPELPAIDGWQFGEITAFLGDDAGDAYVVAPDGTRAGIVWEIGDGEIQEILPQEPSRWGVYAIWFPEPNSSTEALQRNLRSVLPQLIAAYNRARGVEG